jgi:radical SAM superfamily enzyme YgiQ (UPF0313 family)
MKKEDLKIALCICPQWSISTPSFALGSLNTALTEAGYNSTQYDINMMSSLYLKENHRKYFKKWTQDNPWSTKEVFWEQIVPVFQEFWFDTVKELSKFDAVSFTIYTSNIMTTDYLARYLRQINPNIHIWYGGPFCQYTECGGLVEKYKYREFVDVGCGTNEGEKTIVELATDFLENGNYENTKGIWRWNKLRPSFASVLNKGRSGRTPVYTGNLQIMNLNTLSTPTWSEEVLKGYTEIRKEDKTSDFGPKLTVPIQGSRGCTFKCTFCSETRLYRYRSPEKLIEDIIKLNKEYGVENFWFTDSLINGSISNFEKFVDIMNKNIKEKEIPKVNWGGYFRTHKKMNYELLKKAKESGLYYLNIGVESGVSKILSLMEKNQTPDLVRSTLEACSDNHIKFDANWIPGYPKETTMDFLVGLKFLYDVKECFKYDWNSGRINLMKGTDVLDDTPLDLYRDIFDISKDESLLKNWVSNDYKNHIFIRHLRAHLIDLFLDIFKMNQQERFPLMDKSKNVINFKCDGDKESVNDDIFKNRFLRTPQYHDTTEFEDILVWGIWNEIKAYVWLLHNLKKNPTIEFSINDNLETFNLNNVIYNTHVKFTSKNNYFNLLINLKIKVSEEDKEFLNIKGLEDLNIEKKFNHTGWFDDENSKEVEDMYLDSFNTDKYKLNIPRTVMTGRY